jgi:cystathionine beta-lyase/cystathionine gamma-synthase
MSHDTNREPSIFTTALHAGRRPPPHKSTPSVPPIFTSVGYTYEALEDAAAALAGEKKDFIYLRMSGPNQEMLEEAIAAMELADDAVCFGSGMAALYVAILAVAHKGGKILAAEHIYGPTRKLMGWLHANMDIGAHYVDMLDLDKTEQAIKTIQPTAIILEVLTNPLVRVHDLPAIADMAHDVGAQVIVDNTFATPFLIQPMDYGADLVMHSASKFLSGHGDLLAGVVAGPSDLCNVMRDHRQLLGAVLGPFDAWLLLRGIRTLPVRMQYSSRSARQIAAWLTDHERIGRVFYPGLTTDAGNALAAELFRRGYFGAMLAFEVAGLDKMGAFKLIDSLRVIDPVTSLGHEESLISHPATASHRDLTPEARSALGITDGVMRLSIGLEDPNDLAADLAQAIAAV